MHKRFGSRCIICFLGFAWFRANAKCSVHFTLWKTLKQSAALFQHENFLSFHFNHFSFYRGKEKPFISWFWKKNKRKSLEGRSWVLSVVSTIQCRKGKNKSTPYDHPSNHQGVIIPQANYLDKYSTLFKNFTVKF